MPSSAARRRRPRSGSPISTGRDARAASHTAIELSTANRPFIFDSVLGELQALGQPVRLVVHPILDVQRDAAGGSRSLRRGRARAPPSNAERESFVHIHVPLIRDAADKTALAETLAALLTEVRLATDDWRAMRARHARRHRPISAATIRTFRAAVVEETIAFLQWLDEGNFVFLGMREYSYDGEVDEPIEATAAERPRAAPRPGGDGASPRHGAGGDDAGDPRLPASPPIR